MIRQFMHNGIAGFNHVQITSLASSKHEMFITEDRIIPIHLGKNADKIVFENKVDLPVTGHRKGEYFYLYTIPLYNYYHMLLDSVGCLTRYFELKESRPNLKLLVNESPLRKGGVKKHPPFVAELLDLLDIEWEYTDQTVTYETVYFGDTQGQDKNGKRITPRDIQYQLLHRIIDRAKSRAIAPKHANVYLSRRAHANPLNNRKDILGEDNTVKRGLTNEDEVVDILSSLGYAEVFGENYTLAEKIVLFNGMQKYISTAGAGVANILWSMPKSIQVGGISTPGFPFPREDHPRHICCNKKWVHATINMYPHEVLFIDPAAGALNYNNPWYIKNLDLFRDWASRI